MQEPMFLNIYAELQVINPWETQFIQFMLNKDIDPFLEMMQLDEDVVVTAEVGAWYIVGAQ